MATLAASMAGDKLSYSYSYSTKIYYWFHFHVVSRTNYLFRRLAFCLLPFAFFAFCLLPDAMINLVFNFHFDFSKEYGVLRSAGEVPDVCMYVCPQFHMSKIINSTETVVFQNNSNRPLAQVSNHRQVASLNRGIIIAARLLLLKDSHAP